MLSKSNVKLETNMNDAKIKWDYKWMVDFGQLVDQKINSWPKLIVSFELGYSYVIQTRHDSNEIMINV